MLLLADCPDEMNYITELEVMCIQFDIKLIVCWSFMEAAQYIRTLKAYENRGKNTLTGLSKASTVREQSAEALCFHKTISKRDADRLLDRYGSVSEIIKEPDYRQFQEIASMGKKKVDVLTQGFKGQLLTK